MPLLFNWRGNKKRRQKLRRGRPRAEIILWEYLRKRRFYNYKFRRQHGIGRYIVDFYCPRLKLAIELDGDSHFRYKQIEYNAIRQEWIENHGIKVIRFYNNEIFEDIERVLLKLKDKCNIQKPNHPFPLLE